MFSLHIHISGKVFPPEVHGVGLAVRSTLLRNLPSVPPGHSKRLMTLRIPLSNNVYARKTKAIPTLNIACLEQTSKRIELQANLLNVCQSRPTPPTELHTEPNDGIHIRYRFDGNVINARRLKAKTLTATIPVYELQYADDDAIVTHEALSLQQSLTSLHQTYSRLSLDINPNKTDGIQTAFKRHDPVARLHIDVSLSNVDSFIYLGSVISDNGHIDKDSLRLRVFSNSNLRLTTKIGLSSYCFITALQL
ncbi:unnamed protein product [Acanthosepion pharaonis]|uniref:Uncharacterized protein n=1 Tax=Acanthosepion pharaonis TaxID=158019 RepID=A0A812C2Z0_ACAPH|nr:unnamed protein product [Sepia pharaonis]